MTLDSLPHVSTPARTGFFGRRLVALAAAIGAASAALASDGGWIPVRWQDENAYELRQSEWRAIVSVNRGRLVHFGPADREENLLVAVASKDTPAGWGGHRVWLGPQNAWAPFWPPPAAWEKSAAEKVTVGGNTLTLEMPPAGQGWPQLARVYSLTDDGELACRIDITGGSRPAQIMHIVQTTPAEDLTVPLVPTAEAPRGCLLLPPFRGRREPVPLAEPLEYMSLTASGLRLHHPAALDKIGFPPQTLTARYGDVTLDVARGAVLGTEVGAPDSGFYTQVCPGQDGTPAVELEQMSPLFAAGEPASFAILLRLRRD